MNDKFNFTKLDPKIRVLMIEEIENARATELYFSTRFNDLGRRRWPELLLEAAREHDEHWLAYQLESEGAMKHLETKAKPKGGFKKNYYRLRSGRREKV